MNGSRRVPSVPPYRVRVEPTRTTPTLHRAHILRSVDRMQLL